MDPSPRFDWARTFEVLNAMEAIDSAPTFGPCVLESLSLVVECDLGSYNEIDPVAERAVYHIYSGEETPVPPDTGRGRRGGGRVSRAYDEECPAHGKGQLDRSSHFSLLSRTGNSRLTRRIWCDRVVVYTQK